MTLGRIPKNSQAKQNGLLNNAFPNDENNNSLQSINIVDSSSLFDGT